MDCTVGLGGHACEMLRAIGERGFLIGIDRDMEALKLARDRLHKVSTRVRLYKANFKDIDVVLDRAKLEKIDGILFDLGVSSFQLESPERGFSFQLDGPLDMRMDVTESITASDIVNGCTRQELESIFRRFGEESFARRIAAKLTERRQKARIKSTAELADVVKNTLPYKFRFRKIHPATKVFMALRIAVNRELDNIEEGIRKSLPYLKKGARICVLSFHSIEDRAVKNIFKKHAESGLLNIVTKKPVAPSAGEISENPRARSAKLRVAERTGGI